MELFDPDLEELIQAWGGHPPTQLVAEYRRLNRTKRSVALARVSALQKLTTDPRPERAHQAAVAAELGLGLKRLQALMRAWHQPSIDMVTPRSRKHARKPLSSVGIEIGRRIVDKAIRRNPRIAEPSVHRRVAKVCARLNTKAPARMTVRRMLDRARRGLEPGDLVASSETKPAKLAYPGDTLILTIENLRGRLRLRDGTERIARALILADTVTGLVLAASPEHQYASVGRKAANTVRHLPVTSSSAWHPIELLVLGPPTPAVEWEDRLRIRAKRLSVAITRETGRSTRRWTSSLLWRGTDELSPKVGNSTEPTADLPLYDEQAFEAALDEAAYVHNEEMERLIDAKWDENMRSKDGHVEAAAILLERLFP